MANGDIVSCSINPTAWQALLTISGMGQSGAYNLGFGPNNSISSPNLPKIIFNVLSSGYNDQTFPTGIARTVYGTTGIRLSYPNQLQKDEVVNGGNVILKIALSDFIYQKDSQITVNILSGYYNSGAIISSGVTNLSVTNNSELAYPKVIANWSIVPYQRATSLTFPLKCVAFHCSAQQGRPVRAVKFIGNDEHGNYASGITTTPVIDPTATDPIPVIEYIYSLPLNNMVTGDTVTGNFIAYPWYGDSGSLIATNDGINKPPSPLYCPFPFLNDKSGNYGVSIAIVDSVTGNNNVGQVVDIANFNVNNPPPAYATIHSGARAISVYNNLNRGRNDVGAGIIYLKAGNHTWASGSSTYGNLPKTHLTITKYPSDTPFSARIADRDSDTAISKITRLSGIHINNSNAFCFNDGAATTSFWVDECYINSTGASTFAELRTLFFTNNTVDFLKQGLKQFTTDNTSFALIRGNKINRLDDNNFIYCFTILGNSGSANNITITDFVAGTTVPQNSNPILAFNYFQKIAPASANFIFFKSHKTGVAIVQNLMENIGEAVTASNSIYEDLFHTNNILIWHNSFPGCKNNYAYNDNGVIPYFKTNWSEINNIYDDYNQKADTFVTADGNRTGNWQGIFGVGCNGNVYAELSGIGAPGAFTKEFPGISFGGSGAVQIIDTGWMKYVDNKAHHGFAFGSGGGNYRLQASSPAINLPINWVLPYDIAGNLRTLGDAAGAYTFTAEQIAAIVAASSGNLGLYILGNPQRLSLSSNLSNNKLMGI